MDRVLISGTIDVVGVWPIATRARIPSVGCRLRRADFALDAATLAHRLLGRLLVRRLDDGTILAGRIVETEAYVGVEDRASHAFGGRRTARNEAMYAMPGTSYIYFTYGMHHCMNVVCARRGEPAAVLIRALEPMVGVERMREIRTATRRSDAPETSQIHTHQLCRGPARLCRAMAIDRRLNGLDLVRAGPLWIAELGLSERTDGRGLKGGAMLPVKSGRWRVRRAPRVGVVYAGDWASRPLRWFIDGHPSVSVRPRLVKRARQES